MADLIPWSNLLPQYQSPQAMAASAASTANTQAQTGLIGAQTQGVDIGNQSSQLSLDALRQAMNGGGAPGPGSNVGGSSPSIGGTGVDPDDVTQHAIQSFAPLPTARPAAVLNQMYAYSRAGKPDIAAAIGAQYDAQVQGANQQRQLSANQAYQTAQSVADAPPGAAFAVLSRYNPQAAEAIKKQYPDDSGAQLDADVREYAGHVGAATHQYTGRPTDMENGVLVDKNAGRPVLGTDQVLTGLSAEAKQKAFNEANAPITVGDQLAQPTWKAAGYPSAEAYVVAADRAARSSAANPPQGGPPTTPGQIPASTSQLPASSSQSTPTPSAAPEPKAAPAPSPAVTDPVLKQALADPDYKIQPLPAPKSQEDLKSNNDLIAARNGARTDLLKDSSDATNTAAQALTFTKAAQAIMASNGNVAGLGADTRAQISRAMQAAGWSKGVDATNYQELSKYLGNAALQGAKQSYGSKMTESEVKLQMEQLSPEATKTPDAINNLLNTNAKNLQYTLDTAKRVKPYLASGNDPQSFAQWNDSHFNRSGAVLGSAAQAKPMPAADKLGAYATAHFGGDTSKAQAYLSQQGYK